MEQGTSAGTVEMKAGGYQSGKEPIVIVFDCSVELCVVGELACKARGLVRVGVRLNVTTANLRCSAEDKLAWRYYDNGWVYVLSLAQRYLPSFLLPSIVGLYG